MAERRPLGAGRQGQRRGRCSRCRTRRLPPLLLRPGRAPGTRRFPSLPAGRVHRRGALHAPLRELLPRRARPRRRRARGVADRPLHAGGNVRLRRAAPTRAAEPRPRPALRPRADGDGRERAGPRRLLARDGRTPLRARVGDLGRASKFSYWSPRRDDVRERAVNPYALRRDRGTWYVVGHDLDHDAVGRDFRVSRIRSDIRFTTRRERDFRPAARLRRRRVPGRRVAARPHRRHGTGRGERRHGVVGAPHAPRGGHAHGRRLRDRVRGDQLAGWVLRQNGRAVPLEPDELRTACAEGLRRIRHTKPCRRSSPASRRSSSTVDGTERPAPPSRRSASACCRRCSPTCSPPAATPRRPSSKRTSARRFHIPRDELQDHLSLLNLVNFGGCCTVYAEARRRPRPRRREALRRRLPARPRPTPLGRGRSGSHSTSSGRRSPPRCTRRSTACGRSWRRRSASSRTRPRSHARPGDEEELVATLSRAIEQRRVVAIDYLKEGEDTPSERLIEPYSLERVLPNWLVHSWDRTLGRQAIVPARPDALGAARR